MKRISLVLLFLTMVALIYNCSICSIRGIGISPAEIRAQDVIGSGVIGTITIVNTVNESRYIVIEIQSPPEIPSEQQHLRVICENCHDTHQRYEIVNNCCPKCSSSNLTVYERIPEDVLKYLSLKGKGCTVIKNGSTYVTEKQYSMREECIVEIFIDLPSDLEYSNKNWEVHIAATTTPNITSVNMGMAAGVQMRLLLDTSDYSPASSFLPEDISPYIIVGISIFSIAIVSIFIKRNAIKVIFYSFRNVSIFGYRKLGSDKKPSSSYNKPIDDTKNVKPIFGSSKKIEKDDEAFKNIEEKIDKLLSNLKPKN